MFWIFGGIGKYFDTKNFWIYSTLKLYYVSEFAFFHSHCGVSNPNWTEVRHFVKFLEIQLDSCEQSMYCNEAFVGDVMSGLKSFVVKFMIKMSRVKLKNLCTL